MTTRNEKILLVVMREMGHLIDSGEMHSDYLPERLTDAGIAHADELLNSGFWPEPDEFRECLRFIIKKATQAKRRSAKQ